jgi:benzoate transport
MNLRKAIQTQPMRWMQIRTIAICLVLAMIDGFEVLVMAFVAPHLAKAWNLGPVQVGYLLSSGVLGTALGALLLSPLADRWGRRRHALVCLTFITVGMGLSALATDVPQLVACRAFAGMFIGALVATLNVTASEYASTKRRGLVMGLYGVGLPGGAALGGALSTVLIGLYDWRAPFVFGAAITAAMLLVSCATFPESIEFLTARRPRNALKAYNRIGAKLGYPAETQLPAPRLAAKLVAVRTSVFGGIMLRRTLLLWAGFALLTSAFYFANTWTGKLLTDVTGDPRLGSKAAVLVPLGGVVGAGLFAALSTVMRPRRVTVLVLLGGAIAFFLYAQSLQNIDMALWLAFLVGVFANGGIAAFYAISPSIYPAAARASGVGWMIAFGRGIAILTPVTAGYLLAAGWTAQHTYLLFASVLVVSATITLLLDRTYRRRSEDTEAPDARFELVAAAGS